MANHLGRSLVYRGFRRELVTRFGEEQTAALWRDANAALAQLRRKYADLDRDSRMMILPAVALYTTLKAHAPQDALLLLKDYGARMGRKIAGVIQTVTSIPGVPKLLWQHMPHLMRTMSSPEKGYSRHIVSETDELVGVDILACPLHDAALRIGVPEAAQIVCAMDKAYMTGFRHIRYTRTTSVAEGGECCDYRLAYDPEKR